MNLIDIFVNHFKTPSNRKEGWSYDRHSLTAAINRSVLKQLLPEVERELGVIIKEKIELQKKAEAELDLRLKEERQRKIDDLERQKSDLEGAIKSAKGSIKTEVVIETKQKPKKEKKTIEDEADSLVK